MRLWRYWSFGALWRQFSGSSFRPSQRQVTLFACGCIRIAWPRLVAREFEGDIESPHVIRRVLSAKAADWLLDMDIEGARRLADLFIAEVRVLAERERIKSEQNELFEDLFGLESTRKTSPVTDSTALAVARHIYDARAFDVMPILADALEDAGADPLLIEHCRSGRRHWRGCWVLDRLRGESANDAARPGHELTGATE